MAESEGWPKQPQGDGTYWWQADANDTDPDIHFVQGEYFYQVGFASSEVVANFGGEWLGPITPSDAEQLSELRSAAQATLTWIQQSFSDEIVECGRDVLVRLQRASLLSQERKEPK